MGYFPLAAMQAAAPDPVSGMFGAGFVSPWRRDSGTARDACHVVAYDEGRQVPIDLAPLSAEVPAWRLDDTRALVTVGPAGAQPASMRAAQLYRSLLDHGAGLEAVQPGEGFSTWEGSPLWLSLAAIRKPAALGVLAVSAPGRVEVMRTEHGLWLVEHAGGPWRAPRALRHDPGAGDDEALLLDILYGLTADAADTPALGRFEAARAALLFVGSMPGPAGRCAQEAWAMVARCCAIAAIVAPGGSALGNLSSAAEAATARALDSVLSVVVDGLPPAEAPGPLGIAPLTRDRFIALALAGDPARIAAGLRGLGRATLDRVRQGRIEAIDPLEALGLAACLGRLRGSMVRPNTPPPRPLAIHGASWRRP
jgi:hypothetical protein